MALLDVPPTLLARYDAAGPRYTSYPAVPDWVGPFGAADFRAALGRVDADEAIALYVHFPFCAARCHYCGCNATVTTRAEVVDRYLDRLDREVAMVVDALGHRPLVTQLHWGGGTPNFLSDAQLERAYAIVAGRLPFAPTIERSVEADPRLVTRAQLRTLRRLGFDRISYGVQDLDPTVQAAIGRPQPRPVVESAIALARTLGFTSLNVDLIYGLPHQTADTLAETLSAVEAMGPDRIACFGYAHVPWMKANQRQIDGSTLPDADARFALYRQTVETLTAQGYEWIGLDHFARPTDPLAVAARERRLHRTFMGYTTRPGSHLLGFGTSAISEIGGTFAQFAGHLGRWQRAIDDGALAVERGHRLTAEDRTRGQAIQQLMCNGVLSRSALTGVLADVPDRLQPFLDDGLLTRQDDVYAVTPAGRLFVRSICLLLDGYRTVGADTAPRFSRVV